MAKRPCARPGCGELVVKGYCEAHRKDSAQARNDARRGSSAARGYGYRWQQYRGGYLRRNPLCVGWPKGVHGERVEVARHVDHIVPVSGADDPLFWEPTNHQGLCGSCHSSKTASEDGGFGRARGGSSGRGRGSKSSEGIAA